MPSRYNLSASRLVVVRALSWVALAPAPSAKTWATSRSTIWNKLSLGPSTLVCAKVRPPGMSSSVALITTCSAGPTILP